MALPRYPRFTFSAYYGRLFLDAFEAAGGVVPDEPMDPRLEAAVTEAGKAVAKKFPRTSDIPTEPDLKITVPEW